MDILIAESFEYFHSNYWRKEVL